MCTQCYFLGKHVSHKILLLDDEESLKSQNINFDLTLKDFFGNYEKIIKLKEKVEQEIIKINKSYDDVFSYLSKSFEAKHEKLYIEENNLKENLQNEVTKYKEKLENFLSECTNLIRTCDKINKGIKKIENIEENNIIKNISYISKINKTQKEMKVLDNQLMRNIQINFEEEKGNLNFLDYIFNGFPIPSNIEINDIGAKSLKVSWKINNININDIINKFIFIVAIKKEKENNFSEAFKGNSYNCKIENLSENTNYEIKICMSYNNYAGPWSEIQKIQTRKPNLFG